MFIRLYRVQLKGFQMDDLSKHWELSERVIEVFYRGYNTLGYGFLEKVYENALLIELQKMEIHATAQCQIQVLYDGK